MERHVRDGRRCRLFRGLDAPPVTAFRMVCRDPSSKLTAAGGTFAGDVSGALPCRGAAATRVPRSLGLPRRFSAPQFSNYRPKRRHAPSEARPGGSEPKTPPPPPPRR
ncbi:hypothetical protein TcCL_ESM00356 [Trypanosoma cruzi]|nr:hypothetical protein TcCL_ESM00356 [Trypanosoma cruzi]